MSVSHEDEMMGGRRRKERRKRDEPIPFADRRKGPRRREVDRRSEPRLN